MPARTVAARPRALILALLLCLPTGLWAQQKLQVRRQDPGAADRKFLHTMGVANEAAALRAYLLPGDGGESWHRRIVRQLYRLDSASGSERDDAYRGLLAEGAAVRDVMDELALSPRSAELRLRWRSLRTDLESIQSVRPAAIRQLAQVEGAAARGTLMQLLEIGGSRAELQALFAALQGIGLPEEADCLALLPKLRPFALAGLIDLCRKAGRPLHAELEGLLHAPHAGVRLAAAKLFVENGSALGLLALVEILRMGDTAQRLVAEDWLCRYTGATLPCLPYGTAEERAVAADAWQAWLEDDGGLNDEDREAHPRISGDRSVICDFMNARVLVLDKDDKVIHTIENVAGACHVRVLASGSLLVAAAHARQVIEYDSDYKQVWVFSPELGNGQEFVGCAERMPNGNTMVLLIGWTSERSTILEVNPEGEVVRTLTGLTKVDDADLLPDGRLLLCETGTDEVRIVDWEGRESWAISCSDPREADLLPNGNVLVADGEAGRVFEADPEGQIVWEFNNIVEPHEADRLPNGNTTICDAEGNLILEVDSSKKVVWKYNNVSHPDDHDRYVDVD